MDLASISSISGIIASLFTGVGLIYAGWQIKLLKKTHTDNHDWNRRLAAQEAVANLRLHAPIAAELNKLFNSTNLTEGIPLDVILKAFKEDKSIQNKVNEILNGYESLARGVYQGIYDEEVVKSARRGAMIQQFVAYESYIKDRRINVYKNAYLQIESLANKWKLEDNSNHYRNKTG